MNTTKSNTSPELEAVREVSKFLYAKLRENELYPEDIDPHFNDPNYVDIYISGDWKHDHIRLDNVMHTLGYVLIEQCEIGSSDDDWYEAMHRYRKDPPITDEIFSNIFEDEFLK